MHVFLLERVLEQQLLEEVGVGDDRVVLQVLRDLLGGFLGELLADLRVDEPDRFVAEARPRVVAVGTHHLEVAGTAVEVLHDLQRPLVLGLDLDGLLDDILAEVLPGESQSRSPNVVPFLGLVAIQLYLSLHFTNILKLYSISIS